MPKNNKPTQASGNSKKNIFKRACDGFATAKTFWSAFSLLVILLIISTVLLSIRLHDYVTTDDRALSLRTSMDESLKVFAVEYESSNGEISVKGHDGTKVIAPGTDVEYTLRLRNTDKVALDYCFTPQIEYTSEYELPIVVRLLDPDDNYVVGNERTWVPIKDISTVVCEGTLVKGETAEYVFQWKWPFDSSNDAYDSFLGSSTIEENIGINLSFALHSDANTTVESNGGFLSSPPGKIIVLFAILLLLVSAILLLLAHIIRKNRERAALMQSNVGNGKSPSDAGVDKN